MKYERRPIQRADLQGYTVTSFGEIYNQYGQLVTPWQDERGKLTITVGKSWHVVDRLVANAFVESEGEKFLVKHIDDDETSCRADNLIWVGTPEKEPVSSHSQKQKKEVVFDPSDTDGIQGWDEDGELVERYANMREYLQHHYEDAQEKWKNAAFCLRKAIKGGLCYHGLYWCCYDKSLLYLNPIYAPKDDAPAEDEVVEDDALNDIEPIEDIDEYIEEDTIPAQDIEDEVIEDVEPTIEEEEEAEDTDPATPAQDATPLPIVEEPDIDEVIEEDEVKEEEPHHTTPAEDATPPQDTQGDAIEAWKDRECLRFHTITDVVEFIMKEKQIPRKDVAGNIRKAIKSHGMRYGYRWYCNNKELLYQLPTYLQRTAPQATQSHDASEPIESATVEVKSEQRANDEVKEDTTPPRTEVEQYARHSVKGDMKTIRLTLDDDTTIEVRTSHKKISIEIA